MSAEISRFRSHLTLVLCMMLHAFTHAYGTILVPLYLPMRDELKLWGVGAASLIVTIYGLVYCLLSYPAGVFADRWNRKGLLGAGLIVNALAIAGMGWTRQYEWLIALGVVAGIAGTIFHPAANALSTAHYPKSPGTAIGILSIGSALGFYAGPRFSGWRAESTTWQTPLVEAGVVGVAFGIVFLFLAKEVRNSKAALSSPPLPPGEGRGEGAREIESRDLPNDDTPTRETRDIPTPAALTPTLSRGEREQEGHSSLARHRHRMPSQLKWRTIWIACVLAGRDFAGVAVISLASIYLQKAQGMNVKQAGLIIGSMMLIAIVANPFAVFVSRGRKRLPVLFAVLLTGGFIVASVPHVDLRFVLPVLCIFEAFHLGSYAISEAALLERIHPDVRGRVVGVFLTIAGTIASASPWLMGAWTDAMKTNAANASAYALPFAVLGALHSVASLSVFLIHKLGPTPTHDATNPMTQLNPATLEPVG